MNLIMNYLILIFLLIAHSATFYYNNFLPGIYKPFQGVTISGIVSGLKEADIDSVKYNILDNNSSIIDLQIDQVVHLKRLLQCLLSCQQ